MKKFVASLLKEKWKTAMNEWENDDWHCSSVINSVLSKGKSAIPALFYGLEVLSSVSGKAKLQGFPYWGRGESPKIFSSPHVGKFSLVDSPHQIFIPITAIFKL